MKRVIKVIFLKRTKLKSHNFLTNFSSLEFVENVDEKCDKKNMGRDETSVTLMPMQISFKLELNLNFITENKRKKNCLHNSLEMFIFTMPYVVP